MTGRSVQVVALPPAPANPVALDGALRAGWRSERRFVAALLATQRVLLLVRSRTRHDTGGWLPGGFVWLAVCDDGLVLLASGWLWRDPRPLHQHLPWHAVATAHYNHVTGALLLRSVAESFQPPPLVMPPETAALVLSAWQHAGGMAPGGEPAEKDESHA